MPFKLSHCVAVHVKDREAAVKFYREVLGLETVETDLPQIEFKTDPIRLFLDEADRPATVMEFLVPDVEAARRELEAAGCTVLRWQGKGGDCYIRDPFGFVFNLWQEPEVFGG
jgi:catechol 2,3-dioxygenase-like lactoylglutathione lyase family enzyme